MNRREFFDLMGKSMVGGALVLSGCSNLLDQNNPNALTPKTFWETSDDAIASVNSIYTTFQDTVFLKWHNYMVPALYRGDDIGITHDVQEWWNIAKFLINDTNASCAGLWHDNYLGIFRANQAIENIPNIEMDKRLKNRLIGEAKFLRAYFYFSLVTNFLNVPIITKVNRSNDYAVAQAEPTQTWAQIEEDLKDAISSLPFSYGPSNLGRVTKGAALGYLGMSYMYQKDWNKAENVFKQIIFSKNYALMNNYADVFSEDHEFNKETLLEIQYSQKIISGVSLDSPRNFEESPTQAGGWYECYPNQFLFNEMSKEKTTKGKWDHA